MNTTVGNLSEAAINSLISASPESAVVPSVSPPSPGKATIGATPSSDLAMDRGATPRQSTVGTVSACGTMLRRHASWRSSVDCSDRARALRVEGLAPTIGEDFDELKLGLRAWAKEDPIDALIATVVRRRDRVLPRRARDEPGTARRSWTACCTCRPRSRSATTTCSRRRRSATPSRCSHRPSGRRWRTRPSSRPHARSPPPRSRGSPPRPRKPRLSMALILARLDDIVRLLAADKQ